MKNRKLTQAEEAHIEKIARKLGINLDTATNEEIDKISFRWEFEQGLSQCLELGLVAVVGRNENGELIYRSTEVQLTDDQRFVAVKPKH
jgi:hypothetical protein